MKKKIHLFIILTILATGHSLEAQEKVGGEGEYRGFLIHQGRQALRITPSQPGQVLQIELAPQWSNPSGGKMVWELCDGEGQRLRGGSQSFPPNDPLLIEWSSSAEGKPSAYVLQLQGASGSFAGEILGQFTARVSFWNQNDGSSQGDAPESYEKALLLPIFDTGTYLFEENFISALGDPCDVFKIQIAPNQSLSLKIKPLQWKKAGGKAALRIEFLDRSLRKLKEGTLPFPEDSPFMIRVFQPQIRSAKKIGIYHLMLKMEGEASLIYGLEVEVREGR